MIISIRGVQSLEPGEEDVMELVTQGVLRQEEGEGFSLSYLESELTGLEGTTTTFNPVELRVYFVGSINSNINSVFLEFCSYFFCIVNIFI